MFDEVLESDGTLLTADFLKNRANLQINAEETEGFLEKMDVKLPTQILFKKDMEFELIDYLVKESKLYKEEVR